MKLQKLQEYFVYFKDFAVHSWSGRSVVHQKSIFGGDQINRLRRPQKTPQPFFCDKHTPMTRRGGRNHCVGLLTRTFVVGGPHLHRPSQEIPSDWLSPKMKASAHTAAVPSGIRTRLSCSADEVLRPTCHATDYQVVP